MKLRFKLRHLTLILPALMMAGARPASAGAEVCGQAVQYSFGNVKFHSRDYTVTCQPGGACTVATHALNAAAPLGFSHLFGFRREEASGRWQAVLVDETHRADANSSFSFMVDTNNPGEVAAKLSAAIDGQPPAYFLDPGATELVMAEAKPGNRMQWRYRTGDGSDVTVLFSLIGLTDALEWANCAQAELVSVKADPAELEAEEPEYSGPEEGVPIDLDGKETGEADQ